MTRNFTTHLSGAFNPATLRKLRDHMDSMEAQHDDLAIITPQDVARGEAPIEERLQRIWYEVWRNPSNTLREAFNGHSYVIYPPQVRHINRQHHLVPWHQDIAYQQLLPSERRHREVITCFIPLDDDPYMRTTIQFKPGPDEMMEHGPSGLFGAGLDSVPEGGEYHYEIKLGDALLFGDHALHRSFTPEGALQNRRSLEFRLVKPEHALPRKDYYDLTNERWFSCSTTV